MTNYINLSLTKIQKYVIFAITLGNVLEWYDFYLYIFWSKTLSTVFFREGNASINLIFIIGFFAVGFIFRPLGGLFFGRLGDKIGRKKTFIICLFLMSVPTFLMGFLPGYSQIGIYAPIFLAILRIGQTFPSGGELPGAFCYLYEAGAKNKKFVTSFAGMGNQIGIILAALECLLLEKILPEEIFSDIGWRVSFIVGGLIGMGGIFLRYRLHETSSFHEIVVHHKIVKASIRTVISKNWKKLLRGISFGTMQTLSFHFISILFPLYFLKLRKEDDSLDLIATAVLLCVATVPLPIYGLLAEKYGVSRLAVISCLCLMLLLYPLHVTLKHSEPWNAMIVMGLIALCIACFTAIWPYFLSHLFPTHIRYTCVGLSFNITDGIFGGISSLLSLYLINIKNNFTAVIWIIFLGCIVSLFSCAKIKFHEDSKKKQ